MDVHLWIPFLIAISALLLCFPILPLLFKVPADARYAQGKDISAQLDRTFTRQSLLSDSAAANTADSVDDQSKKIDSLRSFCLVEIVYSYFWASSFFLCNQRP